MPEPIKIETVLEKSLYRLNFYPDNVENLQTELSVIGEAITKIAKHYNFPMDNGIVKSP